MSLASWFSKIPDSELTPEQREQIARLRELQEAVPAFSNIYEVVAVFGIAEALDVFSKITEILAADENYTNCRRCKERLSMLSHELSKMAQFASIACEDLGAESEGGE
jgi:hypothetical protein